MSEANLEIATKLSHGLAARLVDCRNLLDPIGFLHLEHYRQSVTYGILRALADDPDSPSAAADARAVLTSLMEYLPLHIADEEEDLFPALARHCAGEALFERIRAQLSKEHVTDHSLAKALEADLRALAEGVAPGDKANFAAKARAFAELQERHIAWETSAVLPLAEARLDAEDLHQIGRNMAARRGLAYLDQ